MKITVWNDRLRVKLSTAVDLSDDHAIDIKYHKKSWGNNVSTVLRQSSPVEIGSSNSVESSNVAGIAARIEFLTATEMSLREGHVLTMAELQAEFENILRANGAEKVTCSRKALKELITNAIYDVEFHKPRRVNESERVTIKETRDAAIQASEAVNQGNDINEDMKTLFNAALHLRKSINKSKKWVFDGSLETLSKEHYSEELYCFFRWIIIGPNPTLSTEEKNQEVHKRSMALVQSTVSACLTKRQIENKKSEIIKSSREMPLQLAVGIAIHQAVRSKLLVNMLQGFGLSVEYNRLLRVEAQIEASVLKMMEENGGLFLPPDIVKGRHVSFAIDNIDFAEDTDDVLYAEEEIPITLSAKEYAWLFARNLSREEETAGDAGIRQAEEEPHRSKVPVWSAYNSLASPTLPVTRVSAPPLVAAPAHEWSTLLTVLQQAQGITAQVPF